jgi:hypothetical protein
MMSWSGPIATGGMGWVSEVSAGQRTFEYELAQRTPSSILSTYVIPNLPSYITLGTVDPTFVIPTLTVSRMTPGALVLAVRDALRARGRRVRSAAAPERHDGLQARSRHADRQQARTYPVFHPANSW